MLLLSKILFIAFIIIFTFLMSYYEGRKSVLGFWASLILSFIITPILVYFLISILPKKNPIGCPHCNNPYNEAEYCGICGKNSIGERKEGLWYKEQSLEP